MKQQSHEQLLEAAAIVAEPAAPLTRRERLERWADVLDRHAGPLQALYRIEDMTHEERLACGGGDNTPMAVAWRDPVLRRDGLAGNRLGDTMAYFAISDHDAHELLCDCHYLGAMTGRNLAARLRRYARGGLGSWMRRLFTGRWAWPEAGF